MRDISRKIHADTLNKITDLFNIFNDALMILIAT